MNPRNVYPIDYFNPWFVEPIVVNDNTVAGVIDALNRHPLSDDETAQDYVMPARRCRERPGRFRVYGENQDNYHCFVYEKDALSAEPPVYFESCLDLKRDCGIADADILDGDHVRVASRFSDFLWQMLGHHICLRLEWADHLAKEVSGIIFDAGLKLGDEFITLLERDFPAGYTSFASEGVICVPDWGAAFLNARARDLFLDLYKPTYTRVWRA